MESASEIYVVDNEKILLENVNNSSLFNFVEMDSEKNSTIVLTTSSTPPPVYTKDMVFNDGHLLSIIVYSCLFFFSATGNLTVLGVILRRRRRSMPFSRIDFMLLNLCTADLIVTFLMMPLEIAWSWTVSWEGGDFLCRLMAFFRIFGLYLSSFVLVCLAMDRYLAVKLPIQTLGSGRRGKIMITCAWTLSILCSLPQGYVFHLKAHPDFPSYKQCVTFGSLPEHFDMAYRIFGLLMMYALPLVIILFLYCGIVIELYKQTTKSSSGQYNSTDGLRRSGMGNLGKARVKTLKMTITIIGVFFFTWSPYYVMTLWYMIDQSSASRVDYRIQRALFLFACTNSTVNPVVYHIFHLKNSFQSTFRMDLRNGHSRESFYQYQVSNNSSSQVNTYNGNGSCRASRNPSIIITRSIHKGKQILQN